MPSFLSRRYTRPLQAVGSGEKIAGLVILLLLAGIVAAYVWQVRTDTTCLFVADESGKIVRDAFPAAGGEGDPGVRRDAEQSATSDQPYDAPGGDANPFPDAGVEGWLRPAQVARFTPETMYQKINGRADLYLQYYVVGLTFGAYARADDPDRTIDVYWYDMGKPENALGVYRAESPEQPPPAGIGGQSYVAEGAVFFIKGGSYLQVLPAFPDAGDAAAALEIARRIAMQIEDRAGDLWAMEVLPREGRIEASLEYLSENAFGLPFLSNVYTAEYERGAAARGAGRYRLFIHRERDETAAARLVDEYRAYFEENGEVLWTDPDSTRRIIAGRAFGVIDIVFSQGVYFGGVVGASDLEAAKQAALSFHAALSSAKDEG